MTAIQYVENILKNNWSSSITGRPHDVGVIEQSGVSNPDVKVVYESSDEWRRMDLSNYDYITVRDGGIANMTPSSFGWEQEDIDARVTVDIRTKGHPTNGRAGRIALYGERGAGSLAANEAPRWGGLVGEALRVIKSKRKGDAEWSLVKASEADDLSGQMGGQIWRANITVGLEQRSSTIDTST